jgi:hypothetical protein
VYAALRPVARKLSTVTVGYQGVNTTFTAPSDLVWNIL